VFQVNSILYIGKNLLYKSIVQNILNAVCDCSRSISERR